MTRALSRVWRSRATQEHAQAKGKWMAANQKIVTVRRNAWMKDPSRRHQQSGLKKSIDSSIRISSASPLSVTGGFSFPYSWKNNGRKRRSLIILENPGRIDLERKTRTTTRTKPSDGSSGKRKEVGISAMRVREAVMIGRREHGLGLHGKDRPSQRRIPTGIDLKDPITTPRNQSPPRF